MATIVISPNNVASFPHGGGHLWVYMQYVEGLRQLGCDVYWLEQFRSRGDADQDATALAVFQLRMERFGLSDRIILYSRDATTGEREYIGLSRAQAEAIFRRADLLLNFHYAIDPDLLWRFQQTVLVDIDPGLLQFWISTGQLRVPKHDLYFTIGETVGTPAALFPDCGLTWFHIRPPICLDRWPCVHRPDADAFTTISSWWGDEWIKNGEEVYENNKRVTFLQFAELPHMTAQPLELALYLGDGDMGDARLLKRHGWRVRHSLDVAGTPESYQAYIQESRGEFSCAKPSCMKFQNAWVSDRTICYLASGKPVVVQDTGASEFLPNGEGMFRFQTLADAAHALEAINADYRRHATIARDIAETWFDARRVLDEMLRCALSASLT